MLLKLYKSPYVSSHHSLTEVIYLELGVYKNWKSSLSNLKKIKSNIFLMLKFIKGLGYSFSDFLCILYFCSNGMGL